MRDSSKTKVWRPTMRPSAPADETPSWRCRDTTSPGERQDFEPDLGSKAGFSPLDVGFGLAPEPRLELAERQPLQVGLSRSGRSDDRNLGPARRIDGDDLYPGADGGEFEIDLARVFGGWLTGGRPHHASTTT